MNGRENGRNPTSWSSSLLAEPPGVDENRDRISFQVVLATMDRHHPH
jgi:hypothetical protein